MNQSGDVPDAPVSTVQRTAAALPPSGDTSNSNCVQRPPPATGRVTETVPRLGVHTDREQELEEVYIARPQRIGGCDKGHY